jgi:Co/Zn/Cd efflux system component
MSIDAASFLISLTAIYLSRKRPTQTLSFGYARAGIIKIFFFEVEICWDFSLEVLGALASILTIWTVTGILIYIAVERCIHQNFEVDPNVMIIVASCGIIFNIM